MAPISRERIKTLFMVITLLLVIFGLTQRSEAGDALLGVPETSQEHSQWCWAGSSKAVLDYYGTAVRQCNIANWAWGRSDCCDSRTFDWDSECNQPNYMFGADGSLQDILENWGVKSNALYTYLSKPDFVAQIDGDKPFVMRFGWTGGGGHFLDGYGYHQNGDYMDYMDPWPGNGYTRSLYDWVVSASDHNWTHTLQVTSEITAAAILTVSLKGNGAGSVSWNKTKCSTGTCVYTYPSGTPLTLTAKAGTGSALAGWTGCSSSSKNTCRVTMSTDVTVTATFVIPPVMTVSPTSLSYGTVKKDVTYPKIVKVKNTGIGDLLITHAITGTSSSEFSARGCIDPVAQGGSCDITVELTPVSMGTKTAKLIITSNDPKKPTQSVTLSGNAKPPIISVSPRSLSFGTVKIGTTPPPSKTVTIKNTGISDLIITAISDPSDPSFEKSLNTCSSPLPKGGSPCIITVTFDPSDTIRKNDGIDITSNAAAAPVRVRLSGKGR